MVVEDDIDLRGGRYNLLGTIFYIAYILSQWTLIGWKQFKPHQFCAFTVVFWGFVATIQAAAFNWGGLMACRFFLGVVRRILVEPSLPRNDADLLLWCRQKQCSDQEFLSI